MDVLTTGTQPGAGLAWSFGDLTANNTPQAGLTDPLTGLLSRQAFQEATRHQLPPGCALVLFDLDRFKRVNDTLGHVAGDALLRLVGKRVLGATRSATDGRTKDVAFRLGGDEFAIVSNDGDGAHSLGERLVELLSRDYLINGQIATVGASVGLAHFPSDGPDLNALYQNADMALYAAKAAGRGVVRCFHPGLAQQAADRYALERDLRAAIVRAQFELDYQAQVNLRTGSLVGFEALIRWQHPKRGRINPAEFIPLAEEANAIAPIGEWALRTACRDAQAWPAPLPVAVNVSGVQLGDPDRLQRAVVSALTLSGLDPARLEIEITETALMQNPAGAQAALRTLRALGVRIVIDDFGTGYSSLSQLRSFTFDKLKIDRSFVGDLGGSDEAAAVVRAIAALGASLGLTTVAEGVETAAQQDLVQLEGCDVVQGYLHSEPLKADSIAALIRSKLS